MKKNVTKESGKIKPKKRGKYNMNDAVEGNKILSDENVMKDEENIAKLINPYTGESFEGRKGSIAATIKNIATLNKMIKERTKTEELNQAINEFSKLMDVCNAAGMFDLFEPQEWLNSREQPGRVLAAIILLQKHPQKANKESLEILKKLQHDTPYDIIRSNATLALKECENVGKK